MMIFFEVFVTTQSQLRLSLHKKKSPFYVTTVPSPMLFTKLARNHHTHEEEEEHFLYDCI